MDFDIVSFVLGFAGGFATAVAVGQTKFRAIQREAREQVDALENRVSELTRQIRTKTNRRKSK